MSTAENTPKTDTSTQTLPLDEVPTEIRAEDAADVLQQKVARPRIRWGAIAWGLIVGSIAVVTLAITRTTDGRAGVALWFSQLTPGGIWLIVVLAAGGILLLLGLLSAIRRVQRR